MKSLLKAALMLLTAGVVAAPLAAQGASPPPAAPAPQAARAQIMLDPPMKYALVSGLASEVGTPFILGNLAEADKLCQSLGVCITTNQIANQSTVDPAAFSAVHSAVELARAVKVNGKAAVAIVSLTAIFPARGLFNEPPMFVQTSVLDVATGTSQVFYADMEVRVTGPNLRNWIPQSGLNDDLRRRYGLPTDLQ